jgi:hypothetical protein
MNSIFKVMNELPDGVDELKTPWFHKGGTWCRRLVSWPTPLANSQTIIVNKKASSYRGWTHKCHHKICRLKYLKFIIPRWLKTRRRQSTILDLRFSRLGAGAWSPGQCLTLQEKLNRLYSRITVTGQYVPALRLHFPVFFLRAQLFCLC